MKLIKQTMQKQCSRMFLVIAVLKKSKISQENIGSKDFKLFRKPLLLKIYIKFMFLINTTEQGNMLISCSNKLTFNIFLLPK